MILTAQQLLPLAQGTAYIEQRPDGCLRLHRFTPEQEALYKETNPAFYVKALSTAGIKLCFVTDSPTLRLAGTMAASTTRQYFAFDVYVGGDLIGTMDNYTHTTLPDPYPLTQLPLGRFEKTFALHGPADAPGGEKLVTVHFPWSTICDMEAIELADGASLRPVRPAKKLLAFGDSITHGYDALHPSRRYIALLADSLGMEEVNKGIGAETFFPPLAATREPFTPDLITVAYGANDWMNHTRPEFLAGCADFFARLQATYPGVPVVALTPIWRKESITPSTYGEFRQLAADMHALLDGQENLTVLDGIDFVPHEESYFADHRLHPNEKGFAAYHASLWQALAPLVKQLR